MEIRACFGTEAPPGTTRPSSPTRDTDRRERKYLVQLDEIVATLRSDDACLDEI